ncbi:GNAT family N-acetyltransferase [Actinocrispum sp. NPDC049592]|uniref:GNAT family N-acetyltransferase n=1 Tax=Actinocrispum sp. NPDC049592 TaxID=3154835 RepID=UPI00342D39B9
MTHIRHIAPGDWDAITELEAGAYPELSEERAHLESRARSSPGTCFVLDTGTRLAGYLLALPYPLFRYPDLHKPEDTVHEAANLHLHDLVIGKDFRGRGWARRLLAHLEAGTGHERISLISVQGSQGFWASAGFTAFPEVALPSSYGNDAMYMSKEAAHLARQ